MQGAGMMTATSEPACQSLFLAAVHHLTGFGDFVLPSDTTTADKKSSRKQARSDALLLKSYEHE